MPKSSWVTKLAHVRVSHATRIVLDDISFTVLTGAKIGVLGPNGAGKSTILSLIARVQSPTGGEIITAPDVSVGILLQEPLLNDEETVLENVQDAVADTLTIRARYDDVAAELAVRFSADLLAALGALQEDLDRLDAWDLDAQIEQAMMALRCPSADVLVASLSGGERRRVALCRLLLSQPDLLLLDEPTNHLDTASVSWLQQHLAEYPGTVIAVTHDRYFLNEVAEWILEIDRGHAYIYEGNYATYLETKRQRIAVEGRQDAKRRKRLDAELDWVNSGTRARQAKSAARLSRYEQMAAASDKTRKLDFDDFQIPPGPRLGTQVIDVEHVSKGFGGSPLITDLTFSLPRGGIVGVLGPNGVGKTTLFEMLVGRQRPDYGTIRIGETVRIAYVDQGRTGIDSDKNAWEVVADGQSTITVGRVEIPARAYVAAFGFKGSVQQKPIRQFSGGERSRLNLALTLKQGGNVLLLDEPSNDLDTETLASLEDALLDFAGCVVVTSHDRWFLDRIATHILAWEGSVDDPGRWFWFEGNFAEYERNRGERLGAESLIADAGAHRRLTRS